LIADSKFLPEELEITAKSKEEIFAVRHREYPIWGVQFHPESIGTQDGKQIVKNFLEVI
jgi:anthranilate synthase component 2